MKTVYDWSHDCTWGVVPYVQESLDLLNEDTSDSVIMNGAAWLYEKDLRDKFKDYKRRCLLAFWSPCEFTAEENKYHFDDYEFFTEVPIDLLKNLEIMMRIVLGWGRYMAKIIYRPSMS